MQNKIELTKTKAGRRFMGFMKAFNSGDPAQVGAFIEQYTTDEALEQNSAEDWKQQLGRIYSMTGPLKLQQMIASEEYRVVVLMQAHNQQALHLIELSISEDYPHKVAEFSHRPAAI